jgi:hypothetical protein
MAASYIVEDPDPNKFVVIRMGEQRRYVFHVFPDRRVGSYSQRLGQGRTHRRITRSTAHRLSENSPNERRGAWG